GNSLNDGANLVGNPYEQNAQDVAIVFAQLPTEAIESSEDCGPFTQFFLQSLRSEDTADSRGVIMLASAVDATAKHCHAFYLTQNLSVVPLPWYLPNSLESFPLSWSDAIRQRITDSEVRRQKAIMYVGRAFTNSLASIRPNVLTALDTLDPSIDQLKELLDAIENQQISQNQTIANAMFLAWWQVHNPPS